MNCANCGGELRQERAPIGMGESGDEWVCDACPSRWELVNVEVFPMMREAERRGAERAWSAIEKAWTPRFTTQELLTLKDLAKGVRR